MKRLLYGLLVLALMSAPASPGTLPLLGAGKGAAGGAYVGPGDVVTSAKAWYGLRAYSAATRGTRALNVCDVTTAVNVNCTDILTDASTGALVTTAVGGITCPGSSKCAVKILYDQTVGNNCGGSCDLIASAAGGGQSGNEGILTPNCLGSLPCIVLVAGGPRGDWSTVGTFTQSQPFTAAFVTYGATSASAIFGDNGVANLVWYTNTTNLRASWTASADATITNQTHAFQIIFNAGSSDIRVDGVTNPVTTSANFGQPIELASSAGGTYLTGNFYELGFWAGAFTTTPVTGQVVLMCHNQFAYWGTPVSC